MTTDEAIKLAIDLGPIILSIVGALSTVVLSGIALVAKFAWRLHNRRMDNMADVIKTLAEAVNKYETANHDEHKKMWETVQGLRAELHLSIQKLEYTRAGVHELKGTIAVQVQRVDTYIERMGNVDALMQAVLRFIDKIDPNAVPKRATD